MTKAVTSVASAAAIALSLSVASADARSVISTAVKSCKGELICVGTWCWCVLTPSGGSGALTSFMQK